MLGELLARFGVLLCVCAGVLLLPDIYLIAIHLRRGRREILRERRSLEVPTIMPNPVPLVCVQLPVHNEAGLVGPAIDALCSLDWPRERLEIMILDDSTDETSQIAGARTAEWRAAGFNISHVSRSHRQDYKAGALMAGLERTDAAYIAIFDVDYRPEPSFLRTTMSVMLAEPRAAFVQARISYRNREHNALTRAQALELDTFYAYDQAGRNWAGVPMTFNGTCAVWRRKAIEEAGGWSGRSLVEDQDLSFRAFALGWTCRNLVSVAVEGELPEYFGVLAVQRQRWGTGTAQAFRDLPWSLLRHLGWHQTAVFVLIALFYATFSVLLGTIAAVAAITWMLEPARAMIVFLGLLAVLAVVITLKSVGAVLATRILDRPLDRRFILDVAYMWLMHGALVLVVAKSLMTGFLSRQIPFVRTPKKGR